jgi:hypothetical protein
MYVEYLEKLLSDIELHRYSVWLVLWKVKVGQLREVYTVFMYRSFPLCTGASLYAPYSLLLFSNKFWMGRGGRQGV